MSLPPDPRSVYQTDDPPEDAPRARKHHLVREVKRLIEAVALLDCEACNDGELDELITRARELADRTASLPSLAARGGLAMAGGADAALLERSGISGRSNPLAAPLQMRLDEDGICRGTATYGAAYEGPPGCLHGGFVAAAFDDLLGFAQIASGQAGYTGTLTVRMRRPTPLFRPIRYEAGFSRVEGRKIWCWGRAWDDTSLLAETEIVFIAPRGGIPH
jgi:acyl-coenzyme A thioesterase PaaI-like protein